MTVAVTNGVDKNVDDLYGDRFTVALAQATARLECAPYWHSGEKAPSRLVRAGELVRLSRVQLHDERTATVHGSTKPYDITGYHCTCPQSQKGQTHWCVHAVAVKLARTMAEQAPRPSAPDDDELGNGYPVDDETLPLPLPPVSVDERLAAGPHATEERREAYAMLQEDRMSDDAVSYDREHDEDPVAVLEAPVAEPVRVTIPAEYVMQIKGNRHVLYAGLVIGAQRSGLVSLAADWTYNDAELSLAHAVATFADGRRYEDSGDASPSNVSKGIAGHFRRVALTRAKARCLRDALGISECSVEEMEGETPKREVPDMTQPADEKALRQRIWKIVQSRAPEAKTREAVDAWILKHTGLALHPDNYEGILRRMEAR
jgi:hypothetical protein